MKKSNKTILFINHKKAQCGVYEFGKSISDELVKSKKYSFIECECGSLGDLIKNINIYKPSAIIYNYHPSTMPWISKILVPIFLYKSNIYNIKIPQIGIIHEVTNNVVINTSLVKKKFIFKGNNLVNSIFDFYIAADPTIKSNNNVFITGRLVPEYNNCFSVQNIPNIGSFGFGTGKKGFEEIVKYTQDEFDNAIINFNIPFADFGDKTGKNAKKIANKCKAIINKPGIILNITHIFFTRKEMLNFLAKNTINIFLYQNNLSEERGISSVVENALAVRRPICLSNSPMFRHIKDTTPSIIVGNNSISNIIKNGFIPLEKYYNSWNSNNLILEYEKIIDNILLV